MFKKIKEKCKNLLILGRYNSPVGAILLMWPCYWGCLSANVITTTTIQDLIYLTIGSFVMRGAGCCVKDIFYKNYDKEIKRTKSRPLASGKLEIRESIYFIFFQLLIGLIVVVQFEIKIIITSFIVIPFVIIYPLFKRFTYFPQAILGLIFNWGIIIGYMSQSENFSTSVLYLYFAGVFLTIAYDTVYGFQDIQEDKKLGLKSLSILFENKKNYLLIVYFLSFIFFSTFFFKNYSNNLFNFFCSSIIAYFLLRQFFAFKKGFNLMNIFKSNIIFGGLVSVLLIIQYYL